MPAEEGREDLASAGIPVGDVGEGFESRITEASMILGRVVKHKTKKKGSLLHFCIDRTSDREDVDILGRQTRSSGPIVY